MGSGDEAHATGGPADRDWPHGYGEASWWPLVVVVGTVGLYAGVGFAVLAAREEPLVGQTVTAVVLAGGLLAFLGGLAGWTYQGFVSAYWRRVWDDVTARFRWGTALFVCAEVATFAAGFAYYGYIRAGAWPPGRIPHLLTSLVAVNTVLLVASSGTLHVAHVALRAGRRDRFVRALGVTVLLGLAFLIGQAYEYYAFVVVEGFGLAEGAFASAFYGLTGLHGLHVGLGVTMLSVVLLRARRGQYGPDRHASVTAAATYWHFVDGVWLLLVGVLYVGATV